MAMRWIVRLTFGLIRRFSTYPALGLPAGARCSFLLAKHLPERVRKSQLGQYRNRGDGPGQPKKLLEQVRDELWLRQYSLRTEKAYTDWIKRYVRFHRMRSRADVEEGTAKVPASRGV